MLITKINVKTIILLLAIFTVVAGLKVLSQKDFVFLLVEESSTSALTTWPLAYDRQSSAFLDTEEGHLVMPVGKNLFGVSLCAYYRAFSAGVEYHDEIRFRRGGKTTFRFDDPLSFPVTTLEGAEVDAVENRHRLSRGNLTVKRVGKDGVVSVTYGGESFILAPGETFTELLALTPEGRVVVTEDMWDFAVDDYLEMGFPMTRMSFTNLGLWDSGQVLEESLLSGFN